MAIRFDDQHPLPLTFKQPSNKQETAQNFFTRQTAGLNIVSLEMEQEEKEQEAIRKLQEKSLERKKKLLFDNLDLIMRHKEEICATPRYANIDVHYAIKSGGLYIGPVPTLKRYQCAGASVKICLRLSSLLEIFSTDAYRVDCKCGSTAFIRGYTGSSLSGGSQATAFCPRCKNEIRIGNRSYGDYVAPLLSKMNNEITTGAKDIIAKWAQAEAEHEKKAAQGRSSQWSGPSCEFCGDEKPCNLETLLNELRLKEFYEKQKAPKE